MDLRLYLAILWRFRLLVASGLLLALALTMLSFVRITFDGGTPKFSYRAGETWIATTTVFITQEGFALGRSVYDEVLRIEAGPEGTEYVPALSEPTRFASYANLYSRLAMSDEIERRMLRDGPFEGKVTASASSIEGNSSILLPIVNIGGVASTPTAASATAARATAALLEFTRERQDAAGIKPNRRVLLQILNKPDEPVLVKGRSITRPAAVFLGAMFAVFGLAFLLENLRPRMRPQLVDASAVEPETRRSA